MNQYHIWCDLKPGTSDMEFVRAVQKFLGNAKAQDLLVDFRIMRRKLGLAPDNMPEWHIMIDLTGLAQLDQLFGDVATRKAPVETNHFNVNHLVTNVRFALSRDFPDDMRQEGEELF